MAELKVQRFELGPVATNGYLVSAGSQGFVVDAPFDPGAIAIAAKGHAIAVSQIMLTHAHADHIAGLDVLRRELGQPRVYLHELERDWLSEPELNLSIFVGELVSVREADEYLKGGESIQLAGRTWQVLHVPGHSPGSVALYSVADGVVLGGDALFNGSIGRTDLPGGDFDALADSIRSRLYTLPDATIVYPGHGPATTIGREKKSNPFVRG